jgi:hypothetical protein
MIKNIKVQVYDPAIVSTPFRLITIDEFEADIYDNNEHDPYGEKKASSIIKAIKNRNPNYEFRFYTEKDQNILVTIHNQNSPGSELLSSYKHY